MSTLRTLIAKGLLTAGMIAASLATWAGWDCDAPPDSWQPRSAVTALAQRNGWHVDRLKIDDGCYEIKGRDAEGRRFKAKIDPATLQVIGVKREHPDRDRNRGISVPPPPPAASAPSSQVPTIPPSQGAKR